MTEQPAKGWRWGARLPFWPGRPPVVPVVRLSGLIAPRRGFGQNLNLEAVARPLAGAFAVKSAPAVALLINSPGGSPVQSNLIYRRIRALAAEKKKPVIAFVEDAAASGGYILALAGDEIIADPSSIVGSIGVVSAGFGFTRLMERIGVERRVYTAGEKKAQLDPFQPEKTADVEHLKELQREIHDWFIALVRERRPRLADHPDLFTGAFWTGATAGRLGLVDGLGDLRSVLRERYGAKVRLPIFGEKRSTFRRWFGAAANAPLAPGAVDAIMAALEEHAAWKRFGL